MLRDIGKCRRRNGNNLERTKNTEAIRTQGMLVGIDAVINRNDITLGQAVLFLGSNRHVISIDLYQNHVVQRGRVNLLDQYVDRISHFGFEDGFARYLIAKVFKDNVVVANRNRNHQLAVKLVGIDARRSKRTVPVIIQNARLKGISVEVFIIQYHQALAFITDVRQHTGIVQE